MKFGFIPQIFKMNDTDQSYRIYRYRRYRKFKVPSAALLVKTRARNGEREMSVRDLCWEMPRLEL
jgi:hypothetical protein